MLPKVLVVQLGIYSDENKIHTKITKKIAIQTELIFGEGFNFVAVKQKT